AVPLERVHEHAELVDERGGEHDAHRRATGGGGREIDRAGGPVGEPPEHRERHGHVDPDPDHDMESARFSCAVLDEDPAELAIAPYEVVRPFEPDLDAARVANRTAGR